MVLFGNIVAILKVDLQVIEMGFTCGCGIRLVVNGGEGTYKIIRPQAKGERKGFHLVCICSVNMDYIEVERTESLLFGISKALPGLSWSRQPWFQKSNFSERFHVSSSKRF
jgi:hypothetical protein